MLFDGGPTRFGSFSKVSTDWEDVTSVISGGDEDEAEPEVGEVVVV